MIVAQKFQLCTFFERIHVVPLSKIVGLQLALVLLLLQISNSFQD